MVLFWNTWNSDRLKRQGSSHAHPSRITGEGAKTPAGPVGTCYLVQEWSGRVYQLVRPFPNPPFPSPSSTVPPREGKQVVLTLVPRLPSPHPDAPHPPHPTLPAQRQGGQAGGANPGAMPALPAPQCSAPTLTPPYWGWGREGK
ncbi:hypothetical protein H4582DRAFT_2052355 [Lactarius indigo]|nr:hypothetical protein H4582DRAFT_2052355 [Lactarius indigo]